MKWLGYIAIVLLLFGCGGSSDSHVDQILQVMDHEIRGLELGCDMNHVLAKEKADPSNKQDDYLYYDYPLAGDNNYTIAYSFDKKGLYEIQFDVFLKDGAVKGRALFEQFAKRLSKKYGIAKENDPLLVLWNAKAPDGKEIEINLLDESEDYDHDKLSLSFYNFEE